MEEKMKTIKMKVVVVVLVCVLLAAGICGTISIYESQNTTTEMCNDVLVLQTERLSNTLDSQLDNISRSVDTLANTCLNQLDDIEYFQTSNDYVTRYTSIISSSLQETAANSSVALTCYVRFNPEFTSPTSGIFLSRENLDSPFTNITPTDFSMYDPDDLEHVGWYYIPVKNGKPTWMEPYMNENIDVYMLSYVVPLEKDGVSVGIVGMDIDFNTFKNLVKDEKFFDTGYAYLTGSDETVYYHPNLDTGTKAADDSKYGMKETAGFLKDDKNANRVNSYSIGGKKYDTAYTVLNNGMKVGSCVLQSEVLQKATSTTKKIGLGIFMSLILSLIIGIIFSTYVTSPLKKITGVIRTISGLDFRNNDMMEKLCRKKDETGDMSKALSEMQQNIRELVGLIDAAAKNLQSNIAGLEDTTNGVDSLSIDNSAISQELAASMQETAASSDLITRNVTEVVSVANSINDLSENGVTSAQEIQKRAAALYNKTNQATEQTNQMYEEVNRRSQIALKQAKAVDKINEMTHAITEISSQTNLLALNASIEAARAGDAGKGFAVVATEIGNLANQTLETVGNIDSIVKEVVTAVENMAACLKNSTDFLEDTVLSDYREFSSVSEQYTDDAKTFDNMMRQIKDEITDLTDSMNGINTAITEINTTIGDATNGVNSIAESSVTLKDGVSDSLDQVHTSAESIQNLKNVVERFQI